MATALLVLHYVWGHGGDGGLGLYGCKAAFFFFILIRIELIIKIDLAGND